MDKPKVCFVGTEITPSDNDVFVGGHVNNVIRLSKGLSRLGWDVHIVTTRSRFLRRMNFNFPWAKIHVIEVSSRYGSLSYGIDFINKSIKAIEILNRNESFDIVHSHSGFFIFASIPAFLKRKSKIRAIHSLYCPASLFPIESIRGRLGIKALSAGLDKIIAVTNNVKNSLIECGVSKDKIEVVPLCIDTDVFNPFLTSEKMTKAVKEDSDTQVILFVGNVNKTKGLDIFLEAAKKVLYTHQKIKFVITLHEPYEIIEKVKLIASRKLSSCVTVMGVVKNMPALIANADIVVVPFRSTSNVSDVPLVVLEAMAVGKPVIATKIGAIPEVICNGKNGILIEPNSVDLLADAITTLLQNPELRKEISTRASPSVIRKFSHIEVAKELAALYHKVIGGFT